MKNYTFESDSSAGQRSLVERAVASRAGGGVLHVAVAARRHNQGVTYSTTLSAVCKYGVQPTQIAALADALACLTSFAGRLPVSLEADR